MTSKGLAIRVAVALTILLMLPVPGAIGILMDAAPAVPMTGETSGRGTGSRAGENVTIYGRIEDATGTPPARAILVAADSNASQLINYTITTDGNYAFEVPNETTYFFMMVPFTGTTLDGWDLHGYFPKVRYLTVTDVDMESDFIIEPAYEIVLKGHDGTYDLVDKGNFTNTAWSTNMDDISAMAVWSEVDNGTGFKLPSVLIPLGETRDLWFQWSTPGYGRSVVRMDNGSAGWRSDVQGAEIVDVDYQLARTQFKRMTDLFIDYYDQGYTLSNETTTHTMEATSACEEAEGAVGNARLELLHKCTARSLLGIEGMEKDRAVQDIEVNRKGDVLVTVVDSNGLPMQNVTVEYEQTSRDFLFGVFGPVMHSGLEPYEQLWDIGVNYATMGFYWNGVEPTEGDFPFDDINSSWGINELADMGYKLKAHALVYMLDLVMPEYTKTKSYADFKTLVYDHVYTLVDAYKDKIDIWNVVNEANGIHACFGLTREQVTEIIQIGAQAIRDADPDGEILVNNGFDWFGQSNTPGFLIEDSDNITISVHEYMDMLEDEVVPYDIVGQQMYDGGWSDFFLDAGLAPEGMPVPTFDLGFVSYVFDQLDRYDRPIHMTEMSVAGEWNDTMRDAGIWHSPWNETVQADFLREFYTIGFSKRNVEALTWWDIDDRHTFINKGALFDENLDPKPAFYALKELIENWTTIGSGATNGTGVHSFRAFGGDYNLTVSWGNITKELTFHANEQDTTEMMVQLEEYTLRPDLVVNDWEIIMIDDDFLETGEVLLNATINNDGERNATNVTARFIHGTIDNGTDIGNDILIPVIDVGEPVKVSTVWNATGLWGLQNITVVADPDDDIDELNESNNHAREVVDLPLPMYGWLRGEVLENGTSIPISNVSITVRDKNGTYIDRLWSDEEGLFAYDNISIGCYGLVGEKRDYYEAEAEVCVGRAEAVEVQVLMDPITTGNIIGSVLDNKDGTGLEDASVRILENDLSMDTNMGGGYGFFDLVAGNYTLEASLDGYIPSSGTIKVVINTSVVLDFHLEKDAGSLRGNVTDSVTGEAVASAALMLSNLKGQLSNDNGAYRFDDVPSGPYNLSISAEGYYSTVVPVVILANRTIFKDIELDVIEMPVDPNGTISGHVKDASSSDPITRARVTLKELNTTVLTDVDGSFEFANVPPGNYTIEVSAEKYKKGSTSVTLGFQGDVTADIELKAEEKEITDGDLVGLGLMIVVFLAVFIIVSYLLYRKVKRAFAKGPADDDGADDEVMDEDRDDGTGDVDEGGEEE